LIPPHKNAVRRFFLVERFKKPNFSDFIGLQKQKSPTDEPDFL
jgi:hypothetical protein